MVIDFEGKDEIGISCCDRLVPSISCNLVYCCRASTGADAFRHLQWACGDITNNGDCNAFLHQFSSGSKLQRHIADSYEFHTFYFL